MTINDNVTGNDEELCIFRSETPILELKIYSYGVISFVITVFGAIGNTLNLLIFRRNPLKASILIYVIAKTSVDLLAVIFGMTWISKYWRNYDAWQWYWWAYYKCYVELGVWNAFVGAGMLFMVAITIERYASLRYPLKFHALRSKKRGYVAAAIIPSFSLLYFIPHSFKGRIRNFKDRTGGAWLYICCGNKHMINSDVYKAYLWSQQIIFRFMPVIVIFLLNMTMVVQYKQIKEQRRQIMNEKAACKRGGSCSSDPLTRMLLIFSVMFLVCATPSAVLIAINSDDKEGLLGFQIYRAVSNVLEITEYSSSFYIYWLSSKEFRRKVAHVVKLKPRVVEPSLAFVETSHRPIRVNEHVATDEI